MKIIVPMAGEGTRFRQEGYATIKPLIPLGGRPMVARACDSFPDEAEFVFICNRQHLEDTPLRKVLQKIRPKSHILAIDPHAQGPVHSVLQVADQLPDDEEVIVNYGDFELEWGYARFLSTMRRSAADGGLPVFRGFHPAQFTGTKYAYVRTDAAMRVLEIQEKEPYTENKMDEYASVGTHYFRTGTLMKTYFQRAVDENLNTRGEFYCSLPFNPIVRDGKKVLAFEVDKFICFGTPNDVREYQFWHDYFSGRHAAERRKGTR